MKFFLRFPVRSIVVWSETGDHPRRYSKADRIRVARSIRDLSSRSGISSEVSPIIEFNCEAVSLAPKTAGVYSIRLKTEIEYIGASRNISKRLNEHLNGCHNEALSKFVQSGEALVDWYQTLYHGWMECFDLLEYEESHGSYPEFNRSDGGIPF